GKGGPRSGYRHLADKDELRAVRWRRELFGAGGGSASIGNHPPLLRLVGSAGAVAAAGTVGLSALVPAVTVAGVAVGAFGAADDRPGPGGGLAGGGLRGCAPPPPG